MVHLLRMNTLPSEARVVRAGKTALDRRWATAWAARLDLLAGSVQCLVEDISANGAKLRVGAEVNGAVEEQASLALGKYAQIGVRIAWRRGDLMGVQFSLAQPWLVDLVVQATEFHDWSRPVR